MLVKTPLNAVVNCLEIALEKPLDQETKAVLTESHNASKSLVYVIDDLLHLTDTGQHAPIPMIFITFELLQSILTTVEPLQRHASQKSLSFSVGWDVDLPHMLCGDLQRFQYAITHIVTNAIQYTEEGGIKIHISARSITEEDCIIQIAVQDTGIGISDEDLDKLFQEFEQVADDEIQVTESSEYSTAAPLSGAPKKTELGLGLALVARYMKQCGGQIRVKSNLGRGSTFALDVPLLLAKDTTLEEDSGPSATAENDFSMCHGKLMTSATSTVSEHRTEVAIGNPRQIPDRVIPARLQKTSSDVVPPNDAPEATLITRVTRTLVVLVVDDNSVNVTILKRRLERMGHEVMTSPDGRECIEIFHKHHDAVECILMDINVRRTLP
jgi:CheY-like chemotaxis protein